MIHARTVIAACTAWLCLAPFASAGAPRTWIEKEEVWSLLSQLKPCPRVTTVEVQGRRFEKLRLSPCSPGYHRNLGDPVAGKLADLLAFRCAGADITLSCYVYSAYAFKRDDRVEAYEIWFGLVSGGSGYPGGVMGGIFPISFRRAGDAADIVGSYDALAPLPASGSGTAAPTSAPQHPTDMSSDGP